MKFEVNLVQKGFLLGICLFCAPLLAQDSDELYASTDDVIILVLEPSYTSSKSNTSFEKKYHYLVARAYFRLLADAQNSERKLKLELESYQLENRKSDRENNVTFQRKLDLAQKKYSAHSGMLFGLKSWNLFSENRTGDMFYFMLENEDFIFKMYKSKLAEDKMVKYLIYKLADLYHLEVEN